MSKTINITGQFSMAVFDQFSMAVYNREGRLVVLQVEYEEKRVDKDACGNRLS